MNVVWFGDNSAPETVGGKAYRLSVMTRAGLPVPDGFCIPARSIQSITSTKLECELAKLPSASVAVRSSACDEDGKKQSFAGIYKTILNVSGGLPTWNAVQEVHNSALSPAARIYRRRLGIAQAPEMAVIVQRMLRPDAAGVLFMQDPLDGSDRMLIEGSWGLGESVVAGTVTPDRWTLTRDGRVISAQISDKDTAVVPGESGTESIEVPNDDREIPCLSAETLEEIVNLARRCERLFESPQDLEWASAGGRVWILQSRPITATRLRIR